MTVSKMGRVLRELAGGEGKAGDGPVEVMTRLRDFNTVTVMNPTTMEDMAVPADTLVAFTGVRFRELRGEDDRGVDIWEFRVAAPTPSGQPAYANLYVSGDDLFIVRAPSRVL